MAKKKRKRRRAITRGDRKQIISLRATGNSYSQIARAVGLSMSSVKRVLDEVKPDVDAANRALEATKAGHSEETKRFARYIRDALYFGYMKEEEAIEKLLKFLEE